MATCVWTRQVFGNPTSREFEPGRIALDAAGGVVVVMEWRAIWLACAATQAMTTSSPTWTVESHPCVFGYLLSIQVGSDDQAFGFGNHELQDININHLYSLCSTLLHLFDNIRLSSN